MMIQSYEDIIHGCLNFITLTLTFSIFLSNDIDRLFFVFLLIDLIFFEEGHLVKIYWPATLHAD